MYKKLIIKICRFFYAAALLVYGIQQFIYADFRDVFFPAWQSQLPLLRVWAYLFGAALIAAAGAIIFEKKARAASLILGAVLLILFCFVQVPYELISEPNSSWHLGVWANALKELALAGGAFVVAGTFAESPSRPLEENEFFKLLEKMIPLGEIFFAITMTSFGIGHFLYAEILSGTIPDWIHDHLSWTYFAGVALICAGVAIILDIRKKTIATLLGLMIFLWFIMLHLPGAIAVPYAERGNLVASAFDALAFSGIAWLIAAMASKTKEPL